MVQRHEMMGDWEAAMQHISKRERVLLRAGVVAVILGILWAFGRLGGGPVVVY